AGDGRTAAIAGDAGFMARLARSRAVRAFLDTAGWQGAERRHLQGDASTRRYERIRRQGKRAVLMDWPPGIAPPVPDPRVVFRARATEPERYRTALDVRAMLHAAPRPAALPVPGGGRHVLPAFTAEAFAIETSMFLDWYVPHATGRPASPAMRETYDALWRE